MQYHALFLGDTLDENSVFDDLKGLFDTLSQVRMTFCDSVSRMLDSMYWDPPQLVLMPDEVFSQKGSLLLQKLHAEGWSLPLAVLQTTPTKLPEKVFSLQPPFPRSLLSLLESLELPVLSEGWSAQRPLRLEEYLMSRTAKLSAAMLEVQLKNGERGFLELQGGDVWTAIFGEQEGSQAFHALSQGPLLMVKELEIPAESQREGLPLWEQGRHLETQSDLVAFNTQNRSSLKDLLGWSDDEFDRWRSTHGDGPERGELVGPVVTPLPGFSTSLTTQDPGPLHTPLPSFARESILAEDGQEDTNAPVQREPSARLARLDIQRTEPKTEAPKLAGEISSRCRDIVEALPDALACGLVDLDSGSLLGVYHIIPYFTRDYLKTVATAVVDLFRGKGVRYMERLLSEQSGKEVRDSFQEIFLHSESIFLFMKAIVEKGAVLVLVSKKTTNQGMGWAVLRRAVSEIADVMG